MSFPVLAGGFVENVSTVTDLKTGHYILGGFLEADFGGVAEGLEDAEKEIG